MADRSSRLTTSTARHVRKIANLHWHCKCPMGSRIGADDALGNTVRTPKTSSSPTSRTALMPGVTAIPAQNQPRSCQSHTSGASSSSKKPRSCARCDFPRPFEQGRPAEHRRRQKLPLRFKDLCSNTAVGYSTNSRVKTPPAVAALTRTIT